jgi:hypothetical protein
MCEESARDKLMLPSIESFEKGIKGLQRQDCWSSNSCWRRARQQMPTRKLRIMTNGF